MPESSANLTQLLRASASGDKRDLDALMAAIYQDLHRMAVSYMQGERRDHTLQPTALVHEAYLKLIDQRSTNWKDRVHFFAIASQAIRRILVDRARVHHSQKRGGGHQRIPIEHVDVATNQPATSVDGVDIVALDEALTELGELDSVQARIVELRYFSGLTIEEIAGLLNIGKRSVDRQWQCAKAWLYCRLSESSSQDIDYGGSSEGTGRA